MKSDRIVLLGLVFAAVPLLASVSAARHQGQGQPAPREIELKAEKYKYTPDKVEVGVGTVVRFKITALDNTHGFEIEGLKDVKIDIPKGETRTFDYKAEKAGTFKFKCSHRCGLGHGRMSGVLTVK